MKKKCTSCKKDKILDDFYKNGKNYHSYCKQCNKQKTLERQRDIKKQAVAYKGGCCSKCGYNKCLGALQFHHLDPNKKDLSWKSFKLRTFDDKFKQELDKCILVCANCHLEIHTDYCN